MNIEKYYNDNKHKLHEMFDNNEKMIRGRICHSSILILHILTQFVKIERYMEIGVHNGGSMTMLLSGNSQDIEIIGIDLFEDMYDIKCHPNREKYAKYQYFRRDNLLMEKTRENLEKIKDHYGNKSKITLIKGNSYLDETENRVKPLVGELDLLFIDGDHTSDGIKNDFDRYFKYVRNGGFLVFDDYHIPEIYNFINRVVKEEPNITFICEFKSEKSSAIDILFQKN